MTSKEVILGRIKSALQNQSAPMPFPEIKESTDIAFTLPTKDLVENFAERFIELGGKFMYCADEQEMKNFVTKLADERDWKKLYCYDEFLKNTLQHLPSLRTVGLDSDLDAAITTCHLIVSRLGSVVLTSSSGYGRSLPVYTPIHIAIAYNDQVVWDIQDALEGFASTLNLPSQITLTTGPSRTADIEKTLVVGVHGPKEVYLLFIDKPAPMKNA
jgi:L-lactate dehydrogenase complex protein LldG